MNTDTRKHLIQSLRRNGLSYNEILARVKASRSSVSLWCRDIPLTLEQRKLLIQRRGKASQGGLINKEKREKEIQLIKQMASDEIQPLTNKEFKLAGLMLYWAEGGKTAKQIDFANSDPKIIVLMMQWFRQVCRVDNSRFRIQLHLHSGQKEKSIKSFWSSLLGLPLEQFYKSYIKKEGTGHRKNKLYSGTVKIRICDGNLLQKILGWIEGATKQLWAASSAGRAPDSKKGPIHCKVDRVNRVNSGKAKSLNGDKLILSQAERNPAKSSSEGAETRG